MDGMSNLNPDQFRGLTKPEYTQNYQRGWNSGMRGSGLDRADARGEHNSWYDGYTDAAVGRPKFHSRDCSRGPAGAHEDCW